MPYCSSERTIDGVSRAVGASARSYTRQSQTGRNIAACTRSDLLVVPIVPRRAARWPIYVPTRSQRCGPVA